MKVFGFYGTSVRVIMYFLCDSRGQIIFTKHRLSNPSSRELYFERFIRETLASIVIFSDAGQFETIWGAILSSDKYLTSVIATSEHSQHELLSDDF